MNSTQSVKANTSKDKNQTQNSNSSIATVSNSTKSQEFQPQLQTYQKLQEVERQEMIHEAEDEEVQLDQDSMDQNNQVQQLIESSLKMKERQRRPMNELDAVTVQIEELSQIRVIAEKLKELRQSRDKEK